MRGRVNILDQEVPVLQSLSASVPENGLLVEIGAAWGFSAARMAETCPDGAKIISIDPWTLAPQKQQAEREKRYLETTAHVKDKVVPVKSFSQDFDLSILDKYGGEIDLLFIDGDHSFRGVKNDYEKFSPKIKNGGVIVFHDYNEKGAEWVTKFVDTVVVPSGFWWGWRVEYSLWIGTKT